MPRSSVLTIHETFIRNWLDYADIIYDQACNSTFHDKLESIQYNKYLSITGTIRTTSTESLKSRHWCRKLCHFYKIFNQKSSFNLIPNFNRVHNTRPSHNIPSMKVRYDYFINSFFPSAITERKRLDLNLETQQASILLKRSF